MASEAVIIELLGNKGDPIEYICVDGDAWIKGTVLKLSDNREVDTGGTDGNKCAGILTHEKVASDGSLRVSCYTNGLFTLVEDNTAEIAVGKRVTIGKVANEIKLAQAGEAETGDTFGFAMETIAKNGEGTVRVLI